MRALNVLSFFDGISAGQQALKNLGIKVNQYIAIEIQEESKKVTRKNFPNTVFWGNITQLVDDQNFYKSLPKIDLVFAGSPCQGLSRAGLKKGLKDPRSALFHAFTFIFNKIKEDQGNPHIPFFFENVAMLGREGEESARIISKDLGVGYKRFDAIDYSPCKRDRFYWTNINIPMTIISKYKGNKKTYKDVMSKTISRSHIVPSNMNNVMATYKYHKQNLSPNALLKQDGYLYNKVNAHGLPTNNRQAFRVYRIDSKMVAMTAESGGWGAKGGLYLRKKPRNIDLSYSWGGGIQSQKDRVFMPYKETIVVIPSVETCLKAMGFPENYYDGVNMTEGNKRKHIGNSWNLFVVELIFRSLFFYR